MTHTTKRMLADSLKKLSKEKSFDKITVVDIVKDCEINRQTFYYHFRDIYDLVEWIFRAENEKELDGNTSYHTWQQGYWKILCYIKENRRFIKSIYNSSGRDILTKFTSDITYQFVMGAIDEQVKGIRIQKEDKEFVANFYKCAFVGLTLDWVGSGMKEDPQEMVDRISILTHGDIIKALKRFSIDQKLDIEL